MKFEIKKADNFGWKGVKGLSFYKKKDISISYVEVSSKLSRRSNRINDRIYSIVDGEVVFRIGKKNYKLTSGDIIFIPKNTVYAYRPKDTVRLVEINEPEFSKEGEVVL